MDIKKGENHHQANPRQFTPVEQPNVSQPLYIGAFLELYDSHHLHYFRLELSIFQLLF